jgi:uncharacterized protein YukE
MALLGANPEQLDDAASQLEKSAQVLRTGRSNFTHQLAGCYWKGPGAEAFRSLWSSHYAPALDRNAHGLSVMAKTLRNNAKEQRKASESFSTSPFSGGGEGSWSGPGAFPEGGVGGKGPRSDWAAFQDYSNRFFNGASVVGTYVAAAENELMLVEKFRYSSGAVSEAYWAWKPDRLKMATNLFGEAGDAERLIAPMSKFGKIADGAAVGLAGITQLANDWGKYSADEEVGRVVAAGARAYGVNYATALAVASFGGPMGVVAGVAVIAAWYVISEYTPIDDWIVDGAGYLTGHIDDAIEWEIEQLEEGFEQLVDGVEYTIDAVGDALDVVGDSIEDLSDAVGEGFDTVSDVVEDTFDSVIDGAEDLLDDLLPW